MPEISWPGGSSEVFWHSTAHLMAQAVKRLWPEAKLTIGPPVEDGFYYDIDRTPPFVEEDLSRIEETMRAIVKEDLPIRRIEYGTDYAKAREVFLKRGESYKVEMLDDIAAKGEPASAYEQGEFVDLCRGPHVPSTGVLRAVKLLKVAGAYWRADESKQQLNRLYGVSFPTEGQLDAHMKFLAEVEKRDHRRIGADLGLFIAPDEAIPGMPLFPPKGAHLRMQMENYSREKHLARGYEPVWTPQFMRKDLWRISGHLDYYQDNMFFMKAGEKVEHVVKPMNCPGHCLIFRSEGRSYRDLPIRYSEISTVYRREKSGTLHGLLRVQEITQDDAHIFCVPDQLHAELNGVADFVYDVLKDFGFADRVEAVLSTRGPGQSVAGSDEQWNTAERILHEVVVSRGLNPKIEPGEAVFYGPKIDFKVRDSLNRIWQVSTIQLDFNLPQRFQLEYTGADGAKHVPVMIHRALFGAVERFLGLLIEHYVGDFPLWLAPVQARVLTITSDVEPFAREVHRALRAAGIRAELDAAGDKIGYKIRNAEVQKVPVMLVVGKREAAEGKVAVRRRGKGDQGASPVAEVVAKLREEIARRAS